MRTLLVEDNERLSALIADTLRQQGDSVDTAHTAETCFAALDVVEYDLILLDLGLPDGDGMEILRKMRSDGRTTPVIIITARSALGERIQGLDLGADDYLVKPFHVDELLARVRAIMRRPGGSRATTLSLGNLMLDPSVPEAAIDGAPITLSPKETSLLIALVRRAGQVVTKDHLEENLSEFGRELTPNAVEATVSRLRKRLNEAGCGPRIETVRGLGYFIHEPKDGAG